MTTTVDIKDDSRGRPVQKAKVVSFGANSSCIYQSVLKLWFSWIYQFRFSVLQIEITLVKSEKFDELMAAANEEKEAAEAQVQS